MEHPRPAPVLISLALAGALFIPAGAAWQCACVCGIWLVPMLTRPRWRPALFCVMALLSAAPFLASVSRVNASGLSVEWLESILWLSPVYHAFMLWSNPWLSPLMYPDSLFHYTVATPLRAPMVALAILSALVLLLPRTRAAD